jgi:hypothetical protein
MLDPSFVGLALGAGLALCLIPMLPMIALRLRLGSLLAADTTTLAPAVTANKLALITQPFVVNENLTASALTLASTGGLAPISGNTGAQETGVDPITGDQIITISPATSGYRWVTSGATYPTTVYGFALLDSTLATLLAVQALPTPITFTADGQQIDVDPVTMTFVALPLS